jgi:hypothetical protein
VGTRGREDVEEGGMEVVSGMRRRMRCWRAKGEMRASVKSGRVRWRERWAARVSTR